MEDCCAVCAEPLEWTAFGECGHTDTCSKCVARLRFVLGDRRCAICQQEAERVFFTRYAGKFTERLSADDFAGLKGRARSRELFSLAVIDGFFDDEDHFKRIKSLCSFTHPILESGGSDGNLPPFKTLTALRRHIQDKYDRYFCSICLNGRKAFVCEQLLYTKKSLDKHLRVGDEDGPMAASGFKGHPQCRFCHKRFFGESEQFQHNQKEHETCFLCRRANPDQYVYYENYPELEEHFFSAHHPCPHASCLEKRFVIFSTDAELKNHVAKEHKGEMMKGMSRAQLRGALTLQTNFQLRPRDGDGEEDQGAGPSSGIVIGGGGNVHSRIVHGRRGGQGYERDVAQAMQNSIAANSQGDRSAAPQAGGSDTEQAHNFNEQDFPTVSDAHGSQAGPSAGAPSARWAAGGPSVTGPALHVEDFPDLPGAPAVRQPKKKNKHKTATLAERLAGGATGEVRVLNKAQNRAPPRPPPPRRPDPLPQTQAVPSLSPQRPSQATVPHSGPPSRTPSPARPGPAGPAVNHPARSPSPVGPPPASLSQGATYSASTGNDSSVPRAGPSPVRPHQTDVSQPGGGAWTGTSGTIVEASAGTSRSRSGGRPQEDFPALPMSRPHSGAPQPRPPGFEQKANWVPQKPTSRPSGNQANPRQASLPRPEDFPSLQSSGQPGRSRQDGAAGPSSTGSVTPAVKISNGMKAMNKALIQKIKGQISDDAFASFKEQSSAFMSGRMSAADFHSRMVNLQIVHVAVELAGLCPDEMKRAELLSVHTGFVQTNRAVALGEALDNFANFSAWKCTRCSLINTPQADYCEQCDTLRPQAQSRASASRDSFRRDGNGEPQLGGKNRGKKNGKLPKFERLRLGDGSAGSEDVFGLGGEADLSNKGKANSHNVWTQNNLLKSGAQGAGSVGVMKTSAWRKGP